MLHRLLVLIRIILFVKHYILRILGLQRELFLLEGSSAKKNTVNMPLVPCVQHALLFFNAYLVMKFDTFLHRIAIAIIH
jgi:hypothetical protein